MYLLKFAKSQNRNGLSIVQVYHRVLPIKEYWSGDIVSFWAVEIIFLYENLTEYKIEEVLFLSLWIVDSGAISRNPV